MNKLSNYPARILLGLVLPLVSTLALAQTSTPADLGRVDVSGAALTPLVKFNVSQVCPSIAAELQESLQGMAWRYGDLPATRIDFKIAGNQISEVKAPFGDIDASMPVKKAVRRLHCEGTPGVVEKYAFILQFVEDDISRSETAMIQQGQGRIAAVTLIGR
jgi:hypothetical protein